MGGTGRKEVGMSDRLNARERWPEIFEALTPLQGYAVEQSLVAAWHEGAKPSTENVRDLAANARGELSFEEYKARVLQRAAAVRK